MKRTILCIDFDSYFASCEQHFNPNLRNHPIGVTATNGRTCIIAASREAKKKGIKTGMRTWEAVNICPEIIFIPADFDRYLDITKKFLDICSRYSPIVELFSLDELFMDLTPVMHLYPSIFSVVERIKADIRNEIGPVVTVSVGLSHNKLLAKLASGLDKPDGFAEINEKNLDTIYAQIKLTTVCGIGERLKKRLYCLGITNLLTLRDYPLFHLKKEFGNVCALHLKDIAYGKDVSLVRHFTHQETVKSVGRNYCLPQNEYSQERILQIMYELCEEVALKLRKLDKKAKTVGLSLAGEKSMQGRKTTDRYMDKGQDIFEVCYFLYQKWNWQWMVRQISIWVSSIEDKKVTTYSLFEDPRQDKLLKAVDSLNKKYGGHIVRNGYLAYAPKLPTKPNGFLADKYQREEIRKEYSHL